MKVSARYYDGVRAEPHNVTLNIGRHAFFIIIPSLTTTLEWDYTNVVLVEKPESGRPLIISNRIETGVRLIVPDASLYDALAQKIPKQNAPRISISTSAKSLAMWAALAVAVLGGLYGFAPQLSAPLAKSFPRAWEERLGTYVVDALTSEKPTCTGAEGVLALQKLVQILGASSYVSAKVIKENELNAFAAPGGKIVLFSKLVETAETPEELAGVLAHEMGHVEERHPTQGLVRGVGLNLVFTMLFGGAGNSSTTASIAGTLLQLKYSRAFEREADSIAVQKLRHANIDNRGIVTFFARLQAEHMGLEGLLSYISSHPANSERMKAVPQDKHAARYTPALTKAEWEALKQICKTTSK